MPQPTPRLRATVKSLPGDTVDSICHQYYGTTKTVEAVLKANPGLSALPAKLPKGTLVKLPETASVPPTIKETVSLWT